MPDSIFTRDGDRFVPTELASSPWGKGSLHGGPAAGLLARAAFLATPAPDMTIARLTIDLFRAVPDAPLTCSTRFVREGRRIAVAEVSLLAGGANVTRALAGGVEVSRATVLYLQQVPIEVEDALRDTRVPPKLPADLETTTLMGNRPHPLGLSGFHTTVEVKHLREHEFGAGSGSAWIRIPCAFVAGEATAPIVRLAAISDFTNALSSIRLPGGSGFINTDISIHILRPPEGEWICLEAEGAAEPNGIALARATMSDERGAVAYVTQARLANRRLPAAE